MFQLPKEFESIYFTGVNDLKLVVAIVANICIMVSVIKTKLVFTFTDHL